MDNTTIAIIAVLIGVVQIILVFAVVRTAEHTEAMRELLRQIESRLEAMSRGISSGSPAGSKLSTNDNSWVCRCGARNYGSKTCSKCGASKDDR